MMVLEWPQHFSHYKPMEIFLNAQAQLTQQSMIGSGLWHICENKGANQLHGNHAADQHLCFRYIDSTISLLPKFEISGVVPTKCFWSRCFVS